MLHRVEFDVWKAGVSTRYATDVDADGGDDAASKGLIEAHRVAGGGGYKVLAIYPVAPDTPLREGVSAVSDVLPMADVGVEPDGIPEKPEHAAPEEDERSELRGTLDGLGIHYDKRWGVERLKEALAGSGAA